MKYRIYFWIAGALQREYQDPWWSKDFDAEWKRKEFFDNIKKHLHAWVFTEVDGVCLESEYPPKEAKIHYWEENIR